MSGFSINLAQKVANHFFRKTSMAATPGTFLALFIADPTDANITSNEVVAPWYGRQEVTNWTAPATDADSVWIANTNEILFQAVTGSSVTVSHYGLYDAAILGNLLDSGPLTSAKVLNIDDVFVAKAGELILKFK
jgi:hypothetical protein